MDNINIERNRGDMMAKDIVEAVRTAELDADKTEKDAYSKKEQIIKNAEDDAKNTSNALIKEAKQRAEAMLKTAKLQSEKLFEKANSEAQEEVKSLQSKAKQKEAEAVKLIYSELF